MKKHVPRPGRLVAALLLAVHLTGCYSWHTTTIRPAQLIAEENPSAVRITLTDGETVTVKDPTMRNDSIVGVTDAVGALMTRPVGVASRDVRLLEVRRLSVTKSVLTSAVIAAFVSFAPYFDSDFGPD